ncbi:hypothetical protein XELAEV_18031576mg [Xenopus laevis]|uniref:Uncharacterized protein n=1 Tax=Xenopus laevis TaxID=8355 RepID=A0A974CQ77_XENLA|nr:hypothetical protein XELAEV_18031576mg [Xenopus laevis]
MRLDLWSRAESKKSSFLLGTKCSTEAICIYWYIVLLWCVAILWAVETFSALKDLLHHSSRSSIVLLITCSSSGGKTGSIYTAMYCTL